MDALSPPRGCDPWAVHSAKSFSKDGMISPELNETQTSILRILEETGGTEPQTLVERLEIKQSDLERELASLRHMERVRGELRDGRKVIRLW
jgi:DNA-binding MarR family transcriptional regulator